MSLFLVGTVKKSWRGGLWTLTKHLHVLKGSYFVIIVISTFLSASKRYSVDVNLSCDNKPTLSRFMKLKFKVSFTWELENEVHMT